MAAEEFCAWLQGLVAHIQAHHHDPDGSLAEAHCDCGLADDMSLSLSSSEEEMVIKAGKPRKKRPYPKFRNAPPAFK